MTFDEQWNADVTQPVGFGVFDPQGSNYNATGYGLTPQFSGANITLPSLTGTGAGSSPYSIGNLFDVSGIMGQYTNTTPNNQAGQNVPAGYQQCGGFWDFACHARNSIKALTSPSYNPLKSDAQDVAKATGADTGWLESYFIRFAIIILGFIFVAAGLFMFQGKNIVVETAKALK